MPGYLTQKIWSCTLTRKVGRVGAGLVCLAVLSSWSTSQATAANTIIVVPNHATYEVLDTTFVGTDGHPGKLLHARAPFGSGPNPVARPGGCPLQSTINSFWPAAISSSTADQSQMTLRIDFDLPTDVHGNVIATNVRVVLSIDNNAVVTFISSLGTFVQSKTNEGCPTLDQYTLDPIPNNLLTPNSNTLEVAVTDRGVESYVDLKVLADVP